MLELILEPVQEGLEHRLASVPVPDTTGWVENCRQALQALGLVGLHTEQAHYKFVLEVVGAVNKKV